MARISSYPNERPVEDNDAWIGTTYPSRQTRQFRAEDVAKYLNIKGKISISGQMVFRFSSSMSPGAMTGVADDTPFSTVSTLNVSNTDSFGQNVTQFLPYLVNSDLLISEQNDISTFGHYKITSYTPDSGGTFAAINLTFIGGNGNLTLTKYYDVANFVLASEQDKTFVFTQGVPSLTWNITHNLGKFPSVSIVDTSNTGIISQISYINENQLTITNTAAFAGKAYLN